MKNYVFFNRIGESFSVEADPSLPNTWPYVREDISKVYLDCTEQFLNALSFDSRFQPKLSELMESIAIKYKEKLSLDFALKKMGMGKNRFCTYFRNHTGMSYIAYINRVKIEKAACLLTETNQTVEAVGFDCGFDSPSHFYKCFKAHYGMSPAKFRQLHS